MPRKKKRQPKTCHHCGLPGANSTTHCMKRGKHHSKYKPCSAIPENQCTLATIINDNEPSTNSKAQQQPRKKAKTNDHKWFDHICAREILTLLTNIGAPNDLSYSLIASSQAAKISHFPSSANELRNVMFKEIMNNENKNDSYVSNAAAVSALIDPSSKIGDWNADDCINAVTKIFSMRVLCYNELNKDRNDLSDSYGSHRKHQSA